MTDECDRRTDRHSDNKCSCGTSLLTTVIRLLLWAESGNWTWQGYSCLLFLIKLFVYIAVAGCLMFCETDLTRISCVLCERLLLLLQQRFCIVVVHHSSSMSALSKS